MLKVCFCDKVFGLSILVCFSEILVSMCAVHDPASSNGVGVVNASCVTYCSNNSLDYKTCYNYSSSCNESLGFETDVVTPNCTEHCRYAAYTCPEGFISIQTPRPRCIPSTVCDGANPCRYGNCSAGFGERNFSCSCFDGYRNNGSDSTPSYPDDHCAVRQCEHGCVNSTNGTECSCLPGFSLQRDRVSCVFDNSSTYVRCDAKCHHGVCLNETCVCIHGYSLDANGTCTDRNSSYECATFVKICEDRNVSSHQNHTQECKIGSVINNGTCHETDPCSLPSIRNSCEKHGKRCRCKPPADFECYCGLPHYSINGISENESFCISPTSRIFVYRLSLALIDFYENGTYDLMRQLEADVDSRFLPSIVNVSTLNLEVTSFTLDSRSTIAHLSLHVSFADDLGYLGDLIADICTPYPHDTYEDACILPGNFVVRGSKINFTEITNVCDLDDSASHFLCGPLASCVATRGPERYKCDCVDGYQIESYASPMKPNCVDVNECSEHPCHRPNQICRNTLGNYSCDCIPCYVWNQTRNECVSLCDANPCEHRGVCILHELQTGCGFHCVCRDEFKGVTCSEVNDAIRAAKTHVAITGGVLGAILGVTIIIGVLIVYMILKRTGYFSFRASKVFLR